MKKNFIKLCGICVILFSLTSCGQKEVLFDTNSGNKQTQIAINKTYRELTTLSENDFASILFNSKTNLKSTYDIKLQQINDEKLDNILYKNFNSLTYYAEANLNFKGLKENPANSSLTEMYVEKTSISNSSLKNGLYDETSNETLSSSETNYLKDLTLIRRYIENNDDPYYVKVDATEDYTVFANNILNIFSGKFTKEMFDGLLPISIDIDKTFLLSFYNSTSSFFKYEITIDEYALKLEEYLLNGNNANDVYNEGFREVCMALLTSIRDANPINYFTYSGFQNKKDLTVESSFDYSTWKNDFLNNINLAIDSIEEPAKIILGEVNKILTDILPNNVLFDYSYTLTNDKYINKEKTNIQITGKIPNEYVYNFGFLIPVWSADIDFFNYDINVSNETNLTISNKALTITKLIFEESSI